VVTAIWNPQNPTGEIGGTGQYGRWYATPDLETYTYHAYGHYTGVVVLDSDYSLQSATPTDLSTIPRAVWSYSRRTLTMAAATIIAVLRGEELAILRGDTLDIDITGLGDISGRSKLWFTVKNDKDLADSGALIQIEETAGLLYINGAAASVAGNGSITVTDAANGNITIELAAVETAKLDDIGRLYWDMQMLDGSGVVQTMTNGRAVIIGDVTRETS